MATTPAPGRTAARPPLRREPEGCWLGGVCTGIAARYGVDPLALLLAIVVAAAASGLGVALYARAWVAIPLDERHGAPARRLAAGRGGVEVAVGTGLLLLSLLLAGTDGRVDLLLRGCPRTRGGRRAVVPATAASGGD